MLLENALCKDLGQAQAGAPFALAWVIFDLTG